MPYEHELIYSTVARAGIRLAFNSPKQLLDEVFKNRKVIATVDLPCHLDDLLQNLPSSRFDLDTLAYSHTIFPIYAPFVPEHRRTQCLQWMAGVSQGAVHLSLGVNASRIETLPKLRYCPVCLKEQVDRYGECYWSRMWQVQGANCCPEHGILLVEAQHDLRSSQRHDFVTPDTQICFDQTQSEASQDDLLITQKIHELLLNPSSPSPSYEQWTEFYKSLARESGCMRGKHQVDHDAILEKITSRWSRRLLQQHNLDDLQSETGWLRGIFRKHRKSFSYLEHIITIEALSNADWSFDSVLQKVKSFTPCTAVPTQDDEKHSLNLDSQLVEKRQQWLETIQQIGVKAARKAFPALYMQLYRNNKVWLLKTNQDYHQKHVPNGVLIDWKARDKKIVRQLIQLNSRLVNELDGPRRSAKWWSNQVGGTSTVEKNQNFLPLTRQFLKQYSEDISCYQIRRLTKVLIQMELDSDVFPRWIILRMAGVSDERMTPETVKFLSTVLPQ